MEDDIIKMVQDTLELLDEKRNDDKATIIHAISKVYQEDYSMNSYNKLLNSTNITKSVNYHENLITTEKPAINIALELYAYLTSTIIRINRMLDREKEYLKLVEKELMLLMNDSNLEILELEHVGNAIIKEKTDYSLISYHDDEYKDVDHLESILQRRLANDKELNNYYCDRCADDLKYGIDFSNFIDEEEYKEMVDTFNKSIKQTKYKEISFIFNENNT